MLGHDERDNNLGLLHDAYGDRVSSRPRTDIATDTMPAAYAPPWMSRHAMQSPPWQPHGPSTTRSERKPIADILYAIRNKLPLPDAGTKLLANTEARLRSPAAMLELFADVPALVVRTVEIAQRCTFSLAELRYRFPSESLCREGESADGALRRLVTDACQHRYPDGVPTTIARQIEKELALIAQLGVAPYFLTVSEIVEIARAKQILCQGRGSAANSAVCFVLGVTAVDPARVDLLFERFMSPERREPPDIDVDFEHERREEVIQAIYARYGRDRAAMVSEVISYRRKSALRDVGKAFGLSIEQVDRLSGLVMHLDSQGITRARLVDAGLDPDDHTLGQVLRWARELRDSRGICPSTSGALSFRRRSSPALRP